MGIGGVKNASTRHFVFVLFLPFRTYLDVLYVAWKNALKKLSTLQ